MHCLSERNEKLRIPLCIHCPSTGLHGLVFVVFALAVAAAALRGLEAGSAGGSRLDGFAAAGKLTK